MGHMPRAASDVSPPVDGAVSETPYVSVIVPVYNDPEGIRTTLESLTALEYPSDRYEVIVVDNDSTDETLQAAESFATDHENVSVTVERTIQSSYAARNRGIEAANGEVFAFVDADMYVDVDWLDQVVAVMRDSGADYVGCHVELEAPPDASYADLFDSLRGFDIDRYINELKFAPTCCLVVRREVVEAVGRFDDRLVSSGDLEFGNRVADAGFELHYARDVTMYHPTRGSLRSNLKKAVRIGRGRYQLAYYYPDRYGSKLKLLLNPVGYLPPVPWLLSESFRGWETLSTTEKLVLYTIGTLTSFGRSYGRIAEAIVGDHAAKSPEKRTDLSEPAD